MNKDLTSGHTITSEDLEAKKPTGYGIPANHYRNVIGKKLNKNMTKYDFLRAEDLES